MTNGEREAKLLARVARERKRLADLQTDLKLAGLLWAASHTDAALGHMELIHTALIRAIRKEESNV